MTKPQADYVHSMEPTFLTYQQLISGRFLDMEPTNTRKHMLNKARAAMTNVARDRGLFVTSTVLRKIEILLVEDEAFWEPYPLGEVHKQGAVSWRFTYQSTARGAPSEVPRTG